MMSKKNCRLSRCCRRGRKRPIPSGSWNLLPAELKNKIFGFLRIKDLRNFALSSKSSNVAVLNYMQSASGAKHLSAIWKEQRSTREDNYLVLQDGRSSDLALCCQIGLLFKVITALFTTKERIRVVANIFGKMESICKVDVSICEINRRFTCFAIFGQTLVAGWRERDLMYVHGFLEKTSGIDKMIEAVLSATPGYEPLKEHNIREYYQCIYLSFVAKSSSRFWLATILKHFPYVHQARLLYILFGPTRMIDGGGSIDWRAPTRNLVDFVPYKLNEIAKATGDLYQDHRFSEDDILTLIEEVIVLPDNWDPLNIAHYIMSCGGPILSLFMGNNLANGRYRELSIFIVECAGMLMRQGKSMEPLVNTLKLTLQVPAQKADTKSFLKYFPGFLKAVFDIGLSGHTNGIDITLVRKVVTELLTTMSDFHDLFLSLNRHCIYIEETRKPIQQHKQAKEKRLAMMEALLQTLHH